MSVLSGETIIRLTENKELIINPLDKSCIQPASIDLKLGSRIMKGPILEEQGMVVDLVKEKQVAILPGQFACILTLEKLILPLNICGRVGLRSFYARKGLISFCGTQVDPGFSGYLVVPLVNMASAPIILEYGKPFVTIELNYLDKPSPQPYSGDYQEQTDFFPDDINFILHTHAVGITDILGVRQDISELRETFSKRQPRLMSMFGFILAGIFTIISIVSWRFYEPWMAIASLGVALTGLIGGIAFYGESLKKRG